MSWSELPKLGPIYTSLVLGAAMLAIASACSPESEPDSTNSVVSINEIIVPLSRYLDALEGPPFVLWDEVGAPAFSPQSCAEFVGFGVEGNTPSVQNGGDGTYMIALTDTRQQSDGETYRWRFDHTTGEVTSLQEIC